MKKNILSVIAVFGVSLIFIPNNSALDTAFTVSASIPKATGVNITATKVTNDVFGAQVAALAFGELDLDAVNNIFLPDIAAGGTHFAIDVGGTGGAGSPDVTVTFSGETNPAGQTTGLGSKASANFAIVTGGPAPEDQVETDLAAHGPKKLLKDISGENITDTELIGGFLRIRVGIYDGNDATLNAAGGLPFTTGDVPGDYSGTFTVSAVIP